MKTIKETKKLVADGVEIRFTSECFNGEVLDTLVFTDKQDICWIAGNNIEEFAKELSALIEKYRI